MAVNISEFTFVSEKAFMRRIKKYFHEQDFKLKSRRVAKNNKERHYYLIDNDSNIVVSNDFSLKELVQQSYEKDGCLELWEAVETEDSIIVRDGDIYSTGEFKVKTIKK